MIVTIKSYSTHFGDATFSVRNGDGGDSAVIQHVWEQDDYNLRHLRKMVFDGIIDVGAHIGTFMLAARRSFPGIPIVGFEPSLDSCELAIKNTSEPVWHAAVRYDADVEFIDRSVHSGSGHFKDGSNWEIEGNCDIKVKVRTERLETFAWLDASSVLLKLDCEGSEFSILAGMTPDLKRRIKCVIGEYHSVSRDAFERAFVAAFPEMVLVFGDIHGRFGDLELGSFFGFRL